MIMKKFMAAMMVFVMVCMTSTTTTMAMEESSGEEAQYVSYDIEIVEPNYEFFMEVEDVAWTMEDLVKIASYYCHDGSAYRITQVGGCSSGIALTLVIDEQHRYGDCFSIMDQEVQDELVNDVEEHGGESVKLGLKSYEHTNVNTGIKLVFITAIVI